MARTDKQIRATNKQRRDGFLNGSKVNGSIGLVVFCAELDDWARTGDWRGMHDLVARSVHTDQKQFRLMLSEVLDASWAYTSKGFKRNKDKAASDGVNERGMYVREIAKFNELRDKGASFRGYAKVKAEDGRTEDEKTEAAYAKFLAAYIKMCERTGKSVDTIANDARVLKNAEAMEGNAA